MTLEKNLLGFIPVTLGEREGEEEGERRRGRGGGKGEEGKKGGIGEGR